MTTKTMTHAQQQKLIDALALMEPVLVNLGHIDALTKIQAIVLDVIDSEHAK